MSEKLDPLVVTESQAARLLGVTVEAFRKARLAGIVALKPLPLLKRKQRLYSKEALLLWLQKASGLASDTAEDDWAEIIRRRLEPKDA